MKLQEQDPLHSNEVAVNPCSNQLKIHLISIWERKYSHCHFKKSRSGSEHAFVQLAQRLLLSPASPSTAIHATQLCVYSPTEQGSALLLTCLAALPARPYPFHGRMTVELLKNTKKPCLPTKKESAATAPSSSSYSSLF